MFLVACAHPPANDLGRRVDALFAVFANTPGYAVGIIRDGRLVHARGYGSANLDDDIAITPRTVFNVASLPKQFTAAAIALLVRKHRGMRTLWYEGGDLGFSSYMVRFPDQRLTVIVLSNLGTGRAAAKAREVLDVVIPR